MPIVDIRFVTVPEAPLPAGTAAALANALALVFDAPAGALWVRMTPLPAHLYAENESTEAVHPVFVTVLLADLPPSSALQMQAAALTVAVARCLGRDEGQVHVEYAPPGRGRMAFGGRLLT